MVTRSEDKRLMKNQDMVVGTEELGGVCSEECLRRITRVEDLSTVHSLTLTVDTNKTQVDHVGILMPRLAELRLERGSTLESFRDLGSSLLNLRILWLSACGIRHLDGVGALSGLEELYIAFNDVEDLTSIALHDRLEVLDLESNNISDVEQAIQLGTCSRLWSLTLTANPVCSDHHYRRKIVEAVPQLASLDEENITDDDRCPLPLPCREGGGQHVSDLLMMVMDDEARSPPHDHSLRSAPEEQHLPITPTRPYQAACLQSLDQAREKGVNRNHELEVGEFSPALEASRYSGGTASLSASDAADVGPEGRAKQSSMGLPFNIEEDASGASRTKRPQLLSEAPQRREDREAAKSATTPPYTASKFRLDVGYSRPITRYNIGDKGREQVEIQTSGSEKRLDAAGESSATACERDVRRGGGCGKEEGEDTGRGETEVGRWGREERRRGREGREGDTMIPGRYGLNRRSDERGPAVDRKVRDEGRPHAGPTETAQTAVLEEETLVINAIKNLRFFLDSSTRIERCSSPRCYAEVESGTPFTTLGYDSATCDRGWGTTSVNGGKSSSDEQSLLSCRSRGQADDSVSARSQVDDAAGQVKAGYDEHAGGEDCEEDHVWEGKDWLLKVLSLDMGSDSPQTRVRTANEKKNTAASVLTHGSEVSIAGNPAFGLRRRRTPNKTVDNTSIPGRASTPWASAAVTPVKAGKTQHPTARATTVGAERGPGVLEGIEEKREESHPFLSPATTKGRAETTQRPASAVEEVNIALSVHESEAKIEPNADERTAARDTQQLSKLRDACGENNVPLSQASCALASRWPLTSPRHGGIASGSAPSTDDQPRHPTIRASLSCRALLSPPTQSQQRQLDRVRGGGRDSEVEKCFKARIGFLHDGTDTSGRKKGVSCSSASAKAAPLVTNVRRRKRSTSSVNSTSTEAKRSTLQSQSASDLHQTPTRPVGLPTTTDDEHLRIRKHPTRGALSCGTSDDVVRGSVSADSYGEVGRWRRPRLPHGQDQSRTDQLVDGLREERFADGARNLEEVPEYSPTAAADKAGSYRDDKNVAVRSRRAPSDDDGGDSDSSDTSAFRFIGERGMRQRKGSRENLIPSDNGCGNGGGSYGTDRDGVGGPTMTAEHERGKFGRSNNDGTYNYGEGKIPPRVQAVAVGESTQSDCLRDESRMGKQRRWRVEAKMRDEFPNSRTYGGGSSSGSSSISSNRNSNATGKSRFHSQDQGDPLPQKRNRERGGRTAGLTGLGGMIDRMEHEDGRIESVGRGTLESDETIIEMLRGAPENGRLIRTRDSLCEYFRGMERARLCRLLRAAYADRGADECDAKVKKRLMFFERSLESSVR